MAVQLDTKMITRAQELLRGSHKTVILTHMAPDGDAMGSALALWHWLRSMPAEDGVERKVTVIVPNAYPDFFRWMPGAEQIMVYEGNIASCNPLIEEADTFICTDFNDPKRIGPVGEKMCSNTAPKIMMDHHLDPKDFAQIAFSFPEACSSCEIVYRFMEACHAGHEGDTFLSPDIATCIYTGLMTDTGNFSFNSTSYELYLIIAELLRVGAKKDEIYNAVFNQYSTDRVRLTGYALYRKMRIYPEYNLSLITLTADELDMYHYKAGDCEGLVNMPLQIADVYHSVCMREERAKPGTSRSRIRISLRSQGDRPVNIWASEVFHGGGHMNASGGELFGSMEQAVKLFEKTYADYLRKRGE